MREVKNHITIPEYSLWDSSDAQSGIGRHESFIPAFLVHDTPRKTTFVNGVWNRLSKGLEELGENGIPISFTGTLRDGSIEADSVNDPINLMLGFKDACRQMKRMDDAARNSPYRHTLISDIESIVAGSYSNEVKGELNLASDMQLKDSLYKVLSAADGLETPTQEGSLLQTNLIHLGICLEKLEPNKDYPEEFIRLVGLPTKDERILDLMKFRSKQV